MKKRIIISICLFFIYTHNLISMDDNVFFNNKITCKKINAEHKKKLFDLTNKITMENKDLLLNSITAKFTKLKNKIENKEQAILSKIKEDFKINDTLWSNILEINQMVQNHEESSQNFLIPNVTHDINISPNALYLLKKYLVKNDINPNRITIKQSIPNHPKWITESPVPLWSITDKNLIFFSTLPGIIELPFNIYTSINDLKAFSIMYSYAIKSRKTILSHTLCRYVFNFNTTVEELVKNKSFIEYNSNILQFSHIKTACINEKYAHLLHALNNKIFIADDSIFTNAEIHTLLSKIKRYWDSIKWLNKYNNKNIELILKKDPTKEPVTLEELKLWEKNNNYPVCLPKRSGDFNSHNIFDILKTKSFVKVFTGKQDKLAYYFFIAIINNNPIYQAIKTEDNNFRLKILSPNEYNLNTLITKYREHIVRQAIDMGNQYARRKGKLLINIE